MVLLEPQIVEQSEPALVLEPEAAAKVSSRAPRIVGYKCTLAEYAAKLVEAGMQGSKDDVRKLKAWVRRGKVDDQGRARSEMDLPPFDDFGALAGWWRRNMKWKVPDWMERLERHEGESPKPPTSVSAGHIETPASAELPIPEFDGGLTGHSSDLGINYIRSLVQGSIKEMDQARRLGDTKRYWNARRQFEDDVETLRKWEKDLVKIQEGKGEVLRTAVVNEALVSIFGVAAQSFTNGLLSLAKRLAPQLTADETREIVLPLRDRIFSHVKQSRFASAWQPDSEPVKEAAAA